jgi:S1-C subfamily serine protease
MLRIGKVAVLMGIMALSMTGHAFALTTEEIVAKSKPATVRIMIEVRPGQRDLFDFYSYRFDRRFSEPKRVPAGSGVVVSPDGYILTAYHVVRPFDRQPNIYVRLPKEGDYPAEVVAEDKERDLLCLKIKKFGLTSLPLYTGKLEDGNKVFAMGFPRAAITSEISEQESTFTEGNIGAFKQTRQGATLIQTNVAINLGNAGGPLLNTEAQIIGIITGSADKQRRGTYSMFERWFGGEVPVGIGFASSITAAADMMKAATVPFDIAGETPKATESGASATGGGPVAPQGEPQVTPPPPPAPATIGGSVLAVLSQYKWLFFGFGLVLVALIAFVILSLTRKKAKPSSGEQPRQAASPGANSSSSPSPSPAASPSAKNTTYSFGAIKCTGGELSGRSFNLSEKGLNVGRGSDIEISLSSETVSRKHAWIGPVAGEITIKDFGSTNGTFVNGKQIQGAERLKIGDVITFGKSGQDTFTVIG